MCNELDIDRIFTKLGGNMAVDGTDDKVIKLQGVENYSFCTEDAAWVGNEVFSDDEADDEEVAEEANETEGAFVSSLRPTALVGR